MENLHSTEARAPFFPPFLVLALPLQAAIGWTAASTLVAWPFSGALGIPIAIDAVLKRGRLVPCLVAGVAALVGILLPLVAVDSYYFGKLVVAPLNLVMYNVLSSDTSSELYGVEPWWFYFKNCLLNFNIAFVLAVMAPLLMILVNLVPTLRKRCPASRLGLLALAPLYLWLGIFVPQPHKEERFLYPVYPIICLAAAVGLERAALLCSATFRSKVCQRTGTLENHLPLLVSNCLAFDPVFSPNSTLLRTLSVLWHWQCLRSCPSLVPVRFIAATMRLSTSTLRCQA